MNLGGDVWRHEVFVGATGAIAAGTGLAVWLGPTGYGVPVLRQAEWWRCDGCGHAVEWRVRGQLQLSCPHCGAQLPARYDR